MKIYELLIEGIKILKNADIESYKIDAQLLLSKALDKDRIFILTERNFNVDDKTSEEYFRLISLREKRMPVKYITGHCEFMGIDFHIEPKVLIPRPDTEILVEEAIEIIKKNNIKSVADVCCGSGAIGLSIAKLCPNTEVKLFDISDTCIRVSKINAERLEVQDRIDIIKGDTLSYAIKNKIKFDMIISNPPYIKEKEIQNLSRDVKDYEPFEALCGGEDGLYFYEKITSEAISCYNNKGYLLLEIGYDEREGVMDILLKNGYKNISCIKDLSKNDRVIKGIIDL